MNWWYCFIGGRQYGPVTKDVLRAWVAEGRLKATDYVWTVGMASWAEARRVGGLFEGTVVPPNSMVPAARVGGTGGLTPNGTLTAEARNRLSGRWGLPIAFSLLMALIVGAINGVRYVGGLAGLILNGPFELGGVIFYMTFARGGPHSLGMLGAGFRNFGNAFFAHLLVLILVSLWMIVFGLLGIAALIFVAATGPSDGLVVLAVIGFLPGMVAGIVALLAYSQTYYIMADDIKTGPLAAVRGSKELMRGKKGKLFCLYLRFIGWYLLCILTLGIGFLWLVPYMGTTFARFYDDLQPSEAQPSAEGVAPAPEPAPGPALAPAPGPSLEEMGPTVYSPR